MRSKSKSLAIQGGSPNGMPNDMVVVWDWPTRAFHWLFVAAIASAWPSYQYAERLGDPTLRWHRYNGYAILVLVVFRLLWGFLGSSTARWSSFVRWPWTAAGYALDLLAGRDRKFLGHNPLGTYMILALLAAVIAQSLLGLVIVEHNDTTWGPLYKLVGAAKQKDVQYWHGLMLYWVILPLVAAHIVSNTLYGMLKRDPLIRAMITGRKPAADFEDGLEATIARDVTLRAAGTFVLAVAIVFGGIFTMGGKLFY
jgi:cytochrome b